MDRHSDDTRQASVWISIISVVLIVGAVATALAMLQRLPANGPGFAGQGALSVETSLDISYVAGLAQPEGASFSPDGARLATIGVFTPCAPTPHQLTPCGHGLAILNPISGSLIRLVPIEPLLGIPTTSGASKGGPFVSLYGVGWTPDSGWYGMIYSVFNTPKPMTPDDLQDSGLLLFNPSTAGTNIIRSDSGYFSSLGDLSADHPIWDTERQNQRLPSPLLPSLLYSWVDDDAPLALDPVLTPLTHIPVNANTFAPVGNPDGHSPFTIWQPGTLIGPGSSGLSGQRSAFITTFPAWSESGGRVGVFTAGVSLPTPDRALGIVSAPASLGSPYVTPPDAFILAPARDMALTNVQERIGAYGWAQIAWSPDGSILASVTCFARHGEVMELRDTLSGALLGQADLSLSTSDPGCRDLGESQKMGAYPHPNMTISWSPDGHQLILADATADTITIWSIISVR